MSEVSLGYLRILRPELRPVVELSPEFELSDEPVASTRRRRWHLQTAARRILGSSWRVSSCYRYVNERSTSVEIRHVKEEHRAFYHGLQVCGSVWTCPVCSAKITEKRREELTRAIEKWSLDGGSVVMVTLTLQHNSGDELKVLLSALKDSWRRLKAGRRYQSVKARFELAASVNSVEVTHGNSGWHPHIHALFFSRIPEQDFDLDSFKAELVEHYTALLEQHGQYASDFYGIDVKLGDKFAGDYVSKYGMEREMTKSISKRGSSGGRSPFELLESYLDGDEQAAPLFKEYANTFFGTRQLTWSRGAREILGLGEELEDDEIAESEPESELLISLTPQQYKRICDLDLRGEVLEIAAHGDVSLLIKYLHEQVGISPPVWQRAQHETVLDVA